MLLLVLACRAPPTQPSPSESAAPAPETASETGPVETNVVETAGTETGAAPSGPACASPPDRATPARALPVALGAPRWTATGWGAQLSSPRVADLDGDGALEVIVGHGEENADPLDSSGRLTAHDASTGALRWELEVAEDLVGTPLVVDLDHDGALDVVIGGRNAELVRVDAAGSLVWSFNATGGARDAGYYGFVTPAVVPDHDGDGVDDLLLSNGGDPSLAPYAPRPTGQLLVVSGATGQVRVAAPMPDRMETYQSALVVRFTDGARPDVVFGSGGETWGGSAWRVPYDVLLGGSIDDAVPLVTTEERGQIAPPSAGDLDGDCVPDLVIPAWDGTVSARSGADDHELWTATRAGYESWTSPTFGWFDGDDVPDVVASASRGVWPIYDVATHHVWSGRDGTVLLTFDAGQRASCSPIAVDLDQDGRDEVLLVTSTPDALGWTSEVVRIAPERGTWESIGSVHGMVVAAPWAGDLDGDGTTELIVAASDWAEPPSWTLTAWSLGPTAAPTWGAYLGTSGDGQLPHAPTFDGSP